MQLVASTQRTVYQTCEDVLRESGVRGFYVGVGGYIALWGTFSPLMFCLYEQGMALAYRKRDDGRGQGSAGSSSQAAVVPSFGVSFIFGSLAGIIASAVTSPLDVVKTRLQCQTPTSLIRYEGVFDGLYRIAHDEGPRALFRGTLARSLTTGLSTGLMMGCYGVLRAQALVRFGLQSTPSGRSSLEEAVSYTPTPAYRVVPPGDHATLDSTPMVADHQMIGPPPPLSPQGTHPAGPQSPAAQPPREYGFIPPLWATHSRAIASDRAIAGTAAHDQVDGRGAQSARKGTGGGESAGFIPPLPDPIGSVFSAWTRR
mmetsp:Transcript_58598/g.116357  ORF Transcript_58598/g.116357 Transcript_58598/m.116357 type:complete len:314 (-) Transcript_58598:205-1146(-)